MPEKQIPGIPPESDPSLRSQEAGTHDAQENFELDDLQTGDQPVGPSPPAAPDQLLDELLEHEAENNKPDDDTAAKPKAKRTRLKKRLHLKRKRTVKSLSNILAESRQKRKQYKNMLKSSFQEGKRRGREYKESRRKKEKKSRIIRALRRSRVIKKDVNKL